MYTIEEIAKAIREENLTDEQIYKKFGGFKIYIPKVMPNYKEKLLDLFNGYNHHSLATRFNISVNTVYTVVKDAKKNS